MQLKRCDYLPCICFSIDCTRCIVYKRSYNFQPLFLKLKRFNMVIVGSLPPIGPILKNNLNNMIAFSPMC